MNFILDTFRTQTLIRALVEENNRYHLYVNKGN